MKDNRSTKLVICSILVALLAIAAYNLAIFVKAAEPTEPHDANALWTEPSEVEINNYTASPGDKFNVTVWLNLTDLSYVWQTQLHFNTTYFNITNHGYTAGSVSDFFEGHSTIPVSPIIDYVQGFVLYGESLIGADSREAGYGSLMWAEFNLTEVPDQNHLTINFSTPYGGDTFILNPDLETVSMGEVGGTEIPIIPEFAQLVLLFIAAIASATSVVLTKKLKH
ncbi:hypothetical protein GTO27_08125 [Candidatus Bathyarchaeota archaeon]|nr:hypothetical protein [Candidatus Bathyarchaeota archaeon]